MLDWFIIRDEMSDDVVGPVSTHMTAEDVARILKRMFDRDHAETMEVCDTLADVFVRGLDTSALEAYLGVEIECLGDDEVHWGHELMAARETLGLSQEQLARIVLDSDRTRTIKLWEQREGEPVPYDVWETVEDMLDAQDRAIDAALDVIREHPTMTVRLPYWRNQAEYDEHHYVDDGGRCDQANATSRRLAAILDEQGIEVIWTRGSENVVPRQ